MSKRSPLPLVGVSACVKLIDGFPFHAVQQKYLDAEGLRLLADAQASGRRPLTVAAWLIAGTLAALLLLRAL